MTKREFERMTKFLWKRRKGYTLQILSPRWSILFDYPDYGGLPEYLCERLTSEAVDAMQKIWFELCGITLDLKKCKKFRDLREFRRVYKSKLWELSEKVGR